MGTDCIQFDVTNDTSCVWCVDKCVSFDIQELNCQDRCIYDDDDDDNGILIGPLVALGVILILFVIGCIVLWSCMGLLSWRANQDAIERDKNRKQYPLHYVSA